jgi:hypothetical protein
MGGRVLGNVFPLFRLNFGEEKGWKSLVKNISFSFFFFFLLKKKKKLTWTEPHQQSRSPVVTGSTIQTFSPHNLVDCWKSLMRKPFMPVAKRCVHRREPMD